MKKFLLFLFAIIITICAILWCFMGQKSDAYDKHKKYRQTFGVIQYETLNHSLSDSDMKKAEPVFEKAKSAISYSGNEKDCKIEKPLISLCRFTDEYNYTKNVSDVELLTYKEINSVGFLWVEYTRECFNNNGEVVTGSYNTLCLIKTKNDDGNISIEDVIIEPWNNLAVCNTAFVY